MSLFSKEGPHHPFKTNRGRPGVQGEIGDLRNDIDRAFGKLESQISSDRVINVDLSADSTIEDGSVAAPYTTIQAALDHADALGAPSSITTDWVVIEVAPGKYDENLVYRGQWGVHIRSKAAWLSASIESFGDEPALVVTNATEASLAAYRVSGDYGDLVYQGNDGCRRFELSGININAFSSSATNAIEMLGVAETTTSNFLNYVSLFSYCRMGGGRFYARNVVSMIFMEPFNPWNIDLDNVSYLIANGVSMEDLFLTYDAASPYGAPVLGSFGYFLYSGNMEELHIDGVVAVQVSNVKIDESVVIQGTSEVDLYGVRVTDEIADPFVIDIDDDATVRLYGGGTRGNIRIDGDATVEMKNFNVEGNVEVSSGSGSVTAWAATVEGDVDLAAGTGAVVLNDSKIIGTLTDPDTRLSIYPRNVTLNEGIAVKLINKTGAASVKGTIVEASTTTDMAFQVADANSDHPIGVVLDDGVADGGLCYIVVSGVAQVLLKDSTAATRGYWVKVSDAAGRADATVMDPPGADPTHWDEIGHCLETKTGGTDVLVYVILHFN